jgi:hypothetical protein
VLLACEGNEHVAAHGAAAGARVQDAAAGEGRVDGRWQLQALVLEAAFCGTHFVESLFLQIFNEWKMKGTVFFSVCVGR